MIVMEKMTMQIEQEYQDYIEMLYRKEAVLLFHYATTILGNISIAEEAVQETFIIACVKYKNLIKSPNPEGWIMNTHKNVCKNIQKTRNLYLKKLLLLNEDRISAYIEDPFDTLDNDLSTFVSFHDFILLKKIILYGYSYKDLAEELKISVDACKKRAQRAKQRFRKNFNYTTK